MFSRIVGAPSPVPANELTEGTKAAWNAADTLAINNLWTEINDPEGGYTDIAEEFDEKTRHKALEEAKKQPMLTGAKIKMVKDEEWDHWPTDKEAQDWIKEVYGQGQDKTGSGDNKDKRESDGDAEIYAPGFEPKEGDPIMPLA